MRPPFKYMITWRPAWPGGYEVWFRGPGVLLWLLLLPVWTVWRLVRLLVSGWKYGLMVVW